MADIEVARSRPMWFVFRCPALALFLSLVGLSIAVQPLIVVAQQEVPLVRMANDTAAIVTERIPGTVVEFELVRIPEGTLVKPDSATGEVVEVSIPALWFGRYEVLWDAYHAFLYKLDHEGEGAEIDAVMRPSKPYGAPDRGFGTRGYAAISMTYEGAEQFAYWLSIKTGESYRLPTEDEWEYACRAGEDAPEDLEEVAWYWDNAFDTTHPVGTREPNAFGLYDMIGNAGEWCLAADGTPRLCGGSFMSRAADAHCGAREIQTPRWNETDPQIPKSMWWLSDGPFAGFRLVKEP